MSLYNLNSIENIDVGKITIKNFLRKTIEIPIQPTGIYDVESTKGIITIVRNNGQPIVITPHSALTVYFNFIPVDWNLVQELYTMPIDPSSLLVVTKTLEYLNENFKLAKIEWYNINGSTNVSVPQLQFQFAAM